MVVALAAVLCFCAAPAFAEAAETEEHPTTSVRIEIKQDNDSTGASGDVILSACASDAQLGSASSIKSAEASASSTESAKKESEATGFSPSDSTTSQGVSNNGGSAVSDKSDGASGAVQPPSSSANVSAPDATTAKPALKSTFEKVDGVWVYYDAAGKPAKVSKLAPGWVKRESFWYWFPNANSFVRDDFAQVGSARYHFDSRGHMQTKWINANNKRYYADSSGALKSGWLSQGGKWYYLDSSGALVENAWRTIGGQRYYLGDSGRMATGWFKVAKGSPWYYANGSGAVQKGWLQQGRAWYYLGSSGARVESAWRNIRRAWYYFTSGGRMATGWFKEQGKKTWYYANGSGAMQTGWLHQGRVWYYLSSSGAMVEKKWRKVRGTWYYFFNGGRMATGWFKDSKKDHWYYSSGSGAMQTGWIHPGGAWYYMENSGAMHEGWAYLGGIWYYLRPKSGAMVTGRAKIDGKTERFDGNGHYRPGLSRSVLISAINSATGARTVKVSGGSIPKEALARIQADIADIEAQGGSCGIVLVDLTSGAVISSNAWKGYYAASSIKGSYVCAIASSNPGRAGQYGGTISNTISWSSNSDYKALRTAFGGQPMASYMSQAGVSSFSPYSTWVDMSAADQAKLWVRNYDYLSEPKGASTWVGSKYHHTAMSFIDKALGGKYAVSSKAGWIWNGRGSRYHVYDDGGFVEKGDKPYVLAVMSSANSTDQNRLAKLVRDLDSAHSKLKRK